MRVSPTYKVAGKVGPRKIKVQGAFAQTTVPMAREVGEDMTELGDGSTTPWASPDGDIQVGGWVGDLDWAGWQAILGAVVAEEPPLTEGEIWARLHATISALPEICVFLRARLIRARFRTVLEERARCREYSAEAGSGTKCCQAAATLCAFVRAQILRLRARSAYVQ